MENLGHRWIKQREVYSNIELFSQRLGKVAGDLNKTLP